MPAAAKGATMKLKSAYLCIDCDEIFEAQGTNPSCPSCNSRAFSPLSAWVTSWGQYEKEMENKVHVDFYPDYPVVPTAQFIPTAG